MSVIRYLVVDTGVQAFVIIVIKIVGDAGLGVGQVGENGPLADFEHLRFQARPEAFSLGIIVAVAATTLRAQGLVVVEQLAVGVATILFTPIGMHQQARREWLGPKGAL